MQRKFQTKHYSFTNQFPIPLRIICTPIVAMINPIILIKASVACKRNKPRCMNGANNIPIKFNNKAKVIQIKLTQISWLAATVITAVIIPGPTIKGIAKGTKAISS